MKPSSILLWKNVEISRTEVILKRSAEAGKEARQFVLKSHICMKHKLKFELLYFRYKASFLVVICFVFSSLIINNNVLNNFLIYCEYSCQ